MNRLNVLRVAIFILTTVAAWAILSFGSSGSSGLSLGQPASRDYDARSPGRVVDEAETERLRQIAESEVEDQFRHDPAREIEAFAGLAEALTAVRQGVIDTVLPPPTLNPPEITDPPEEATTTEGEETPTTAAVTLVAQGRVFVDGDSDGVFTDPTEEAAPDRGLAAIEILIYDEFGMVLGRTETQSDGTWNVQVSDLAFYAAVNGTDPDFPTGLTLSTANDLQELSCSSAGCEATLVGYGPAVRPLEDQVSDLRAELPTIDSEALLTLARFATEDVFRLAVGDESRLEAINIAAQSRLDSEFRAQIRGPLLQVQQAVLTQPPRVSFPGGAPDETAGAAAAALVNFAVQVNYVYDEEETERLRTLARASVVDQIIEFQPGQSIISQGQLLRQVHIDAIEATGAASGRPGQEGGLLAVLAVLVGSIGFYLARFRPEFWTRPRMAALLGLLIVLGAGAVRLTVSLQDNIQDVSAWYALPGVVFGLMAAVAFDSRIAALMAIALAVLAATATRDPGVATYAVLSAMIPVGFVSSLSSRGSYRRAVLASSVAVAGIAAAVSWFFHTNPDLEPWMTMAQAAGWALGVSLITALIGLAALQFFESAFDVTTSLTLLELTDRNHEALLLLQEKTFGTFNHSLMVGTLADAAARAVGADPLLARAAAYYHDLGKTENPTFFIENQFGAANPHDDLDPRQSVEIIRKHVTDGVDLARKFKIPSEVAEAIVTHHGDGIMRYFYEKARRMEGEDVDPNDFRHVGHKPHSAETAIVMLADSLEAACRAVFAEEEPTPQAIEKVVARVVDEKMNDGQLSESSLTLGQLNRARSAFLDSLVGHYHQRITYPNFPQSNNEAGGDSQP
ncbi:MAG TPA: HDIG domain-containing protein [Acidimicrobiia bacterium]|nr:HDIG domain-containing protein [Acidimicrobiia bacterium]